jgi:hypothetical protein
MNKTLIGLLRRVPFQPFGIQPHDGHRLWVEGVERLSVSRSSFVWVDEAGEYVCVPFSAIRRIQPTEP